MNRNTLAFGVEPSQTRYRLRLARYQGLAEALGSIISATPPRSGKPLDLLDVGVGNGRTYRYAEAQGIAERFRFHGIDLSMRRLDNVYGGKHWQLRQGDVEKGLPYGPQRFDVVVCEQLLEHVHSPQTVLLELARVLRPGGLLIAGVPVFPPGLASIRRHLVPRVRRLLGHETSDHLQAFSLASFRQLLRGTGAFEIEQVRGFRLCSGGPLRWLENFRWWWQLNRFIGQRVPSLCVEVQILARRLPHADAETGLRIAG